MISLALALNLSIEFIGPCGPNPLLKTTVKQDSSESVGSSSISTLDRYEVNYIGSDRGLNSIFDTPIGSEALEIISDNEMRSYGWCFEIDGAIPEVYPDSFPLLDVKREIKWFFGFAHYLNGEWISQCEPAYETRPAFLCGTN